MKEKNIKAWYYTMSQKTLFNRIEILYIIIFDDNEVVTVCVMIQYW